jgi:hypothetical protein
LALSPAQTKSLCQTWLHSREEDKFGVKNYRPTDGSFNFPPARGRYGLIFAADGTGFVTFPGPTDATEQRPFTWSVLVKSGVKTIVFTTKDKEGKEAVETSVLLNVDDKLLQLQPPVQR